MFFMFQYKAKNNKSEDVAGTIEASSEEEAIKKLHDEGLTIVMLKELIAYGSKLWPVVSWLRTSIEKIDNKIVVWCRDKNGFIRLPLLIFFAYVFIKHLIDPSYSGLLHVLNLPIHEFGHAAFYFFCFHQEFLTTAGGTILELLVPLLGFYNFLRQKDYFAAVLCFGWLSTSLFGVATYAGDARAQALPLVSPFMSPFDIADGKNIGQDWNSMLSRMGILQFDWAVAAFFRFWAIFWMLICLVVGGWMIALMTKNLRTHFIKLRA
jgi:hypothetical protein